MLRHTHCLYGGEWVSCILYLKGTLKGFSFFERKLRGGQANKSNNCIENESFSILLVPYLEGVGSWRTNNNVFFSEKMLETCIIAIRRHRIIPTSGCGVTLECISFPDSVHILLHVYSTT